jgi:hypothetical protein
VPQWTAACLFVHSASSHGVNDLRLFPQPCGTELASTYWSRQQVIVALAPRVVAHLVAHLPQMHRSVHNCPPFTEQWSLITSTRPRHIWRTHHYTPHPRRVSSSLHSLPYTPGVHSAQVPLFTYRLVVSGQTRQLIPCCTELTRPIVPPTHVVHSSK